MKQLLRWGVLWLLLSGSGIAHAATEVVEVYFLPLSEAEAAVRTQLSPSGSVSAMPSRRLLLIQDDAEHTEKARALLRQLDVRPVQYHAHLVISQASLQAGHSAGIDATLPGGWVRLTMSAQRDSLHESHRYNLRVQSGKPGLVEAGEVVPLTTRQRSWLAGYGIEESTTLVPVTGGFEVLLQPAGEDRVQVKIHPWLQRMMHAQDRIGQAEVRIGRDSAHPNVSVGRARAVPGPGGPVGRISVAEADTELTVPLGSEVSIAASGSDAKMFGQALLAGSSSAANRQLVIRIRVERAR